MKRERGKNRAHAVMHSLYGRKATRAAIKEEEGGGEMRYTDREDRLKMKRNPRDGGVIKKKNLFPSQILVWSDVSLLLMII